MSVDPSLDHYRGLFRALPTPAWEEDFSGAWRLLRDRGLVGQPADAVRAALTGDPQLLEQCIAAVRILDANEEAVALHRARDKQALLAGLAQILVEVSRDAIIAQLVALAGDGSSLAFDSAVRTLGGERRDVHVRWMVVPGEAVPFSRVVVSTQDITERAEAHRALTRSLDEAAALQALGRRCAELSIDALCSDVVEAAAQAAQADLAVLFVSTPRGLQLRASTRWNAHTTDTWLSPCECLCGLAAKGGSVFARDLEADARCTRSDCKHAGMRSFAALPLRSKGEVVGVLGLSSREPRDLQARASFLEGLAAVAALGLRNALLHEQLSVRAREVEAVAASLRESEQRFRTVLESLAVVGLFLDAQGRILLCSDHLLDMSGWTRAEVIGRDWFDTFIPAHERAVVRDIHRDAMERGEVRAVHENAIVTRTGEARLIAWKNCLVRDPQGRVLGSISLGEDVTEGRKVEAEAERERALNEAAIESLPGLFYMFDATGRFVRWNKNFELTSEYGAAVADMSPLDFFEEPERSLVAGRIAEVFTKGESSVEASFRTKGGGAIPHFFTGRRVVFGDRTCVVGMGVDLSQHKQLEEQLRQAQKMDAIGQLAGGIAHDFNNLLTIIQASSEALVSARESAQQAELVEEIVNATGRAAGLTRQLLAFSRGQKLERRPADLNAHVTALSQMLRRIVGEDVKLSLQVWPEALPAQLDAGLLDQALVNLVINARHAMPAGGTLTIETLPRTVEAEERGWIIEVPPGPYVCVRVVDTGNGISPAHLPHIFEPFFTTREVGSGTGLGLAMVFGIVRQHGGTLRVDSEVARGTRFEILLPALTVAAGSTAPTAAAPSAAPKGNEAILVVEDEDRLRTIVTRVLAGKGYRVLAVGSGPEALRLWSEQRGAFDLLLTDMRLPDGMSGEDIAARLCAERPSLPVLYMSGYLGSDVSATLDLREGDNFLAKPFSPAELLSLVRRRLDAPS